MLTKEQLIVYYILKYGSYLPYRLDIDLDDYTIEQRTVCSIDSPDGIYSCIKEKIETELQIPWQEFLEEESDL